MIQVVGFKRRILNVIRNNSHNNYLCVIEDSWDDYCAVIIVVCIQYNAERFCEVVHMLFMNPNVFLWFSIPYMKDNYMGFAIKFMASFVCCFRVVGGGPLTFCIPMVLLAMQLLQWVITFI